MSAFGFNCREDRTSSSIYSAPAFCVTEISSGPALAKAKDAAEVRVLQQVEQAKHTDEAENHEAHADLLMVRPSSNPLRPCFAVTINS
jgi:hypothetical protein